MLEILCIFVLALLPSLLGWWRTQRAEQRARERFQQLRTLPQAALEAMDFRTTTEERFLAAPLAHYHSLEGVGYVIGDLSCRYNARSAYLRCAVNPLGGCQNCSQYEPLEYLQNLMQSKQ